MAADPYLQIDSALKTGGLAEGLRFLNGRVEHRFTAIYRLDQLVLRNVQLVDKAPDGFDASALEELPLGDSFCQFVLRDGQFKTSQTSAMGELDGHPYQGVLESYVGLPIMKTATDMFGTLCHFDFGRQPISDEEFALLQKVARLLPRYL